ncbi:UDP-N-acetylmuramoyl-tripeptide--D-alanyl-D-alanine ligase MurF [Gimesia alba]|uniref:UDP-N-acetylmuramoyl-tripeptide--D-alanyl-D-alanine ligase n=1 Tax=Gimesia alba TaxID=2527973 RepID=A0A517REV3_9PLAN|nr:UDP-N-acetylmuramoyl-tripeptide--D-alanyl-D-alanine ligase [Gimesia alba]QDT42413.1 UDP-N-acetylmuramoyl-tripeptide--D-alanyl-D-alanine ligase MurF [Gimesia alba]
MDRVSLNQVIQIIQGTPVLPDLVTTEIEGISIDSRTTAAGDLFFAIQGKRLDGHQFATEALRRGAQACVVNRGAEIGRYSQRFITVDNVNEALQLFARWYRSQQQATMIGVTGSVGKTTTRNMIHTALSPYLKGTQSPANYNNEFGVPLSVAQIESVHEYAVLELAASRVGEIRDLAQITQPEIGVITGIGPSHLERFGTLNQTANAKGELFEQLTAQGLAVVNGDDPFAEFLISKTSARTLKVGLGEQNDLQAVSIRQTDDGIWFQFESTEFFIPVQGKHFVSAALVAIAIGKEFGLSNQDLVESLGQFSSVPGRCHVGLVGNWTIIDDSYNASPVSMRAACQVLKDWAGLGKRVLVMGDMLELGAESNRYHQEIGELIATSGIDLLFVCGKQAGAVVQGAVSANLSRDRIVQAPDVTELQSNVASCLEAGDVVLVKGSRGMRMERLISFLNQQVASGEKKISCV